MSSLTDDEKITLLRDLASRLENVETSNMKERSLHRLVVATLRYSARHLRNSDVPFFMNQPAETVRDAAEDYLISCDPEYAKFHWTRMDRVINNRWKKGA